jgi:hypothetical protein
VWKALLGFATNIPIEPKQLPEFVKIFSGPAGFFRLDHAIASSMTVASILSTGGD